MSQLITINYPDNCPPEDSNCFDGYIYIFVKHNPPSFDDFKTSYEKGRYESEDICKRHSISCGKSIEYLNSMEKLFPSRKGWKKAKCKISCEDALLKQTNSNQLHFSCWWLTQDAKIKSIEICEVI